MNSDQFFATNSHSISRSGRDSVANFFRSASTSAFVIAGHTDSRASDDYNMRLSYNRAATIASIASSVGARVVDVRGYGERMPIASNKSSTASRCALVQRLRMLQPAHGAVARQT